MWLRLRGSSPQSAPEVLTPPPEWQHTSGRTLGGVVAEIRTRLDAATGGPGEAR